LPAAAPPRYNRRVEGLDAAEFPVAPCAACAKDVLCWRDLDAADREILRCLDCDQPIDAASVRWLDLHAIEGLGYGYVVPAADCGRPNCGRGRCGRSEA
jgi:hypothetical protein